MGEVIVVRAPNWLGDTVMALPALGALRAGFPQARLTVVGPWAWLLAGQGVADVALAAPSRRSGRWRLARALAGDRPALAVVLPSSFEAACWARLTGAARRVGFDTDARGALLTDRVPRPSPRLHQVEEYLALAQAAGAEPRDPEPRWRLPEDPGQEAAARAALEEAGLAEGARIVGLHLGSAGGPAKQWSAPGWARLARRLAARGSSPVLLGAPLDRAVEAQVQQAAGRPPLPSLVGRDAPAMLPWLLSRLAALVSGDTGVAHLAAALGVPTVTLFGPTDPGLSAPRGPAARILHPGAPCAPCFLPRCPIEHPCMTAITDAAVEAALDEVVGA